jgi:hypothetical protein
MLQQRMELESHKKNLMQSELKRNVKVFHGRRTDMSLGVP